MRARGFAAGLAGLAAGLAAAVAGCGGDSNRTVKVVSDLPLRGGDSVQSAQMEWAIRQVINERYGGKAGDFTIEYKSHDNATDAAGRWTASKCVDNARSYASDDLVVGVIGPVNSGCAEYEIPILNRANVAMVSPSVTAVGLTKGSRATIPGQPQRYYPSGSRNFFRVVPSDDHQGRAGASFMKKELGVTRVYVLDDKGLYGKGVADAFRVSAGQKKIGLKVVGHEGWDADPKDTDPEYTKLIARIKKRRADGIYVGGSVSNNGGKLISELLENTDARLLVSDGFLSSAIFAGGNPVDGVFGTFPAADTTASGDLLKSALVKTDPDAQIDPYTVYAAAAAEVLLDAICRFKGRREDMREAVIANLFETDLETVVGRMGFNENGDPVDAAKTGYLKYKASKGAWTLVRPRPPRPGRQLAAQGRKPCLKPAAKPR